MKGYGVVAYFKQGKSVKGNPAIESTYQGATYFFSSPANKADFDNDPAKYVPKYGAFCSYGVVEGVLADLDTPGAFVYCDLRSRDVMDRQPHFYYSKPCDV